MRHVVALAAALICATALAACGVIHDTIQPTAAQSQPLSVELAGTPDAGQVGLLAANADGSMRRAGITLSLRAPATATQPLADLQADRVDVAVISEPQLMIARAAGDFVLGFGALNQTTDDALVSLRARHLRSVADLRNRAIGTDGSPDDDRLLDAILTSAHVAPSSVHVIDVGSDLAGALQSRRVAATFGAGQATVAALNQAHHPAVMRSAVALGVPAYENLVFVTREKFYAQNVNLMRRFVQATGRGYAALRADPASGVSLLRDSDPSLGAARASTEVTDALATAFPGDGHPWGWQDQGQWNTFGQWMVSRHLIDGPSWYEASTNDMLAGQGP